MYSHGPHGAACLGDVDAPDEMDRNKDEVRT
jgi:hypothetical protein